MPSIIHYYKQDKNMKKLITSALILALTIGSASAQSAPAKEHKKEFKMQQLNRLNLTADQKSKLKTIRDQHQAEVKALKGQSLTQEAFRSQRQAIDQKYLEQAKAILTPAQRQEAEQMLNDWKDKGNKGKRGDKGGFEKGEGKMKGEGKGPGRGEGFRGGDMEKDLNLTADQSKRIGEIRAGFKPQLDALRNDASLSQEQKRARMRELMQQHQEQIKTVLTKEQIQKMESRRKERRGPQTK